MGGLLVIPFSWGQKFLPFLEETVTALISVYRENAAAKVLFLLSIRNGNLSSDVLFGTLGFSMRVVDGTLMNMNIPFLLEFTCLTRPVAGANFHCIVNSEKAI